MNVAELKSDIVLNKIPNLLVFTGEEFGVLSIYTNEIKKKLNGCEVHNMSSVADVLPLCSGKSIFNRKKLFLVTDDMDFLKNEKGWSTLKNVLGDNVIILRYHTHDNRLGFWKFFANETVVFDKMSTSILASHLSKEYGLSVEKCMKLAVGCNNDFVRCQLELDKVKHYANATNKDFEIAFEECYNSEIICTDFDADVFDFVTACLTKNTEKMLILYEQLKRKNEPIVKVLSLLYNGYKNVLIAQTISSAKNIQSTTGINYYSYIKAKEISGYYSNSEIEDVLYQIMQLEQGIKTGKIDDSFAIDFLFLWV